MMAFVDGVGGRVNLSDIDVRQWQSTGQTTAADTDRRRWWKAFLCGVAALALTALTAAGAIAQPTAYSFVPNSGNGTVSVIDTATATIVGSPISTGGTAPTGGAATPDGRRLYIANSGSNSVAVIDVGTLTLVGAPIAVGSQPDAIAITPNGLKAYVANAAANSISVLDTTTNTVVGTIALTGTHPTSIAFTPNGLKALVVNQTSNNVQMIDVATDTVVGSPIPVGNTPQAVAITPNGAKAYVTNSGSNTVSVIDVALGVPGGAAIPVGSVPKGVAVTPDGSMFYVTNSGTDTVSIFDTTTDLAIIVPPSVGTTPVAVAFTPNGTTAFVTNSGSNNVTLIDVGTATPTGTVSVGTSPADQIIGPALIAGCFECGVTVASNDAALTPQGFGPFVDFLGGELFLTGDLTTSRTLSLLTDGVAPYAGTIYTGDHNATLNGSVINDGVLLKVGAGSLTLAGASTHSGGTRVEEGTLIITGTHTGTVQVAAGAGTTGTLTGTGTIGAIDASAGTISPGVGGPGILHATNATIAAGVSFVARINGTVAGTSYDRLDVSGTATLGGATLSVQLGYTPPTATSFTILTHASGTFAGLPDGTFFSAGGAHLRISYHAGSGSDVALIVDSPPTIAGLSNQSILAGSTLGPISFTVGDDITEPSALVVTATSSNASLLPNADLLLGGSGTTRTLTAMPVPGASGATTITVTVSDGFQTTQQAFVLTVIPIPVYYLAEGATGGFFSTDLLLANPNGSPAPAVLTFFKDDGSSVVQNLTLPATSRTTIRVNQIPGLESAAFSTSVTSTSGLSLIVERTMWWDATGYGAHTEKASAAAAAQWYFAEGSQGYFHTYFLLLNPHAVATVAHVTYFLEGGPAVQRDYTVPATSRLTIDAGSEAALANRSFGALVTFDLPGMAERAMYFGTDPIFSGGHDSAGVTAPSMTWFLAEGATGSFFDTFILIANPNDTDANVNVTYLPDNGVPIPKTHLVAGHQRLTINIAAEDPALQSAAVSTRVDSDQPVIAERSQYWPHAGWYEAHNSAGETATGTKWGLAEGRVGGTNSAQTYVLIENPGAQAADITATFLRTDGTTLVKTFSVAPTSRFNISVTGPGSSVPELTDESFGVVIDSTQPVIVERSLYSDAGGVTWAAGTNATATRLP